MTLCPQNKAQAHSKAKHQIWGKLGKLAMLAGLLVLVLAKLMDDGFLYQTGGSTLIVAIGLLVAQFLIRRNSYHVQNDVIVELYPACERSDVRQVALWPAPKGIDGRSHAIDIGYFAIDGDHLVWHGAWFQFRLAPGDITGFNRGMTTSYELMKLRPEALDGLKNIMVQRRTESRKAFAESMDRWHEWQSGRA